MKGDAEIIERLNECLSAELTAINQYFIHSRMCENWGYARLAKQKYQESIGEMKHADAVIKRILYLDGTPNMQRINPVRVGEDPKEQHELDLDLEKENIARLNAAIAICSEKGDNGSRDLLQGILLDEEEGADWIESQLHAIGEIGKENYLAKQLHEGE